MTTRYETVAKFEVFLLKQIKTRISLKYKTNRYHLATKSLLQSTP